jgi:hypothetical protein
MPIPQRKCRKCGELFILGFNKPGNVNDCVSCSEQDIPIYVAKVAHSSKNSSLVELEFTTNHYEAAKFNGAQKRMGAGVTGSLIQSKTTWGE